MMIPCINFGRHLLFLFCISLLCLAAHAQSKEPKRLALVIGNDAYQHVTRLQKASNDATSMGRELKVAGFDVTLARDLNYRSMLRTFEAFTAKLGVGDQAVVFFAGHGVQIKTGSYLLPVDIEATSESEIEKTAYSLDELTQKLGDAKAAFTLVLVDACRDNPLKSNGRSIGGARGLSAVEPPKGQIVVYSASRGQQALDSLSSQDPNPNGVFTRELISRMRQPGVRIEDVVREVRDSVEVLARSVGHEQRPAIYNEARGSFYFFSPRPGQLVTPINPVLPQTAVPSSSPQNEEDSPVVAAFKRSTLAKTSSPVDVAIVTRMLQLPAGEERKPNISGLESVLAFVSNDQFFAAPVGSEKFSFQYFTAHNNAKLAKTCINRGNQVIMTHDYENGSSQGEGVSLLGGILPLEVSSSTRGYLGKVTTRITSIDSLHGQPFPLTTGKRFGLSYTTTRDDAIGKIFGADTSYAKWNVECAVTQSKARGRGGPAHLDRNSIFLSDFSAG